MSSKTTRLGPSSSPLSPITPHLMPFHVEHTGSAPLSTYFIIKPVLQQPDCAGPTTGFTQRLKARFMTAFRGRKMQGLSVKLPDGYSGVVLQTEPLGMAKGKDTAPTKRPSPLRAKGQKDRRPTRSSTRKNVDNDKDEDGDIAMEGEALGGNGAIQTLRPTAKFSSFILWNPDVDVDEGQDEYLRALSEYQQLLAEVHRTDHDCDFMHGLKAPCSKFLL